MLVKQQIKAIDPHPLVTEQVSHPGWQVMPNKKLKFRCHYRF